MKHIISILILVWASTITLSGQEWQSSFEQAKEIATAENKPIILVFQGSDWCAPCIKLEREIWSTDAFKAYAPSHYVMLQADFPRKKKNALSEVQASANAQLAETYNKNGIFPFVVILDHAGKVLGETSYQKITVADYIALLNSFIQ